MKYITDIHDNALQLARFSRNLDDSLAGNVSESGSSRVTVSVGVCHRAVSPESSSSNASISNRANRLKVII